MKMINKLKDRTGVYSDHAVSNPSIGKFILQDYHMSYEKNAATYYSFWYFLNSGQLALRHYA
jgi:hypothetical protein